MAQITVRIASRHYTIACKDGEEEHLLRLAALVDRQSESAAQALGTMPENRQLLMSALLLADELVEARAAASSPSAEDAGVAQALTALAERVESMCEALEHELQAT